MNETLQIVSSIIIGLLNIGLLVKSFIIDKRVVTASTKISTVETKVDAVESKVSDVHNKVDKVKTVQEEVQLELNGRLGELIDLTKKSSHAEGDLAARAQIKEAAQSEEKKPEYMIQKMLEEIKKTIAESLVVHNKASPDAKDEKKV